jgi:hypothetical protein
MWRRNCQGGLLFLITLRLHFATRKFIDSHLPADQLGQQGVAQFGQSAGFNQVIDYSLVRRLFNSSICIYYFTIWDMHINWTEILFADFGKSCSICSSYYFWNILFAKSKMASLEVLIAGIKIK